MKKEYMKPEMKVVLMKARTQLLKASALMIPKYRRGTQLEEDFFNIEEDEII